MAEPARRVYLDHNATTPLDPRALAAMMPWLAGAPANPSSAHFFGQAARAAVEEARAEVAALLGARPIDVVLTGSGTEANNSVIFDLAEREPPGHVVLSAFEHASVRAAVERLVRRGWEATRVSPGSDGAVRADDVVSAVGEATRLVCLMLAQNELGTLQPVPEVAARCRARGVLVFSDAAQAVGKVPVDVAALGVDYLTCGAHKIHGPLGAGALWIRPGAPFGGWLVGGGQERKRRSGTENVAAIVGFGAAARGAREELGARAARLAGLRARFERGLVAAIADVSIHCAHAERLPHTSHLAIAGVDGQELMIRLDLAGFAVSTGSACGSGAVEVSPTLRAAGYDEREAASSLRVSFGPGNDEEEVDLFLAALAREVAALRRPIAAVGR
jgi:cysteine desulfurase